MKIIATAFLIVMYSICLPMYHAVNRKNFRAYLIWALFVGAVWLCALFGTDIFG